MVKGWLCQGTQKSTIPYFILTPGEAMAPISEIMWFKKSE
jgi:hypothetical protein